MTISAHLTPDPERRLLVILESMTQAVDRLDKRVAALTFLAAVEAAFVKLAAPAGPMALAVLAVLGLSLVLGVFSFFPLTGALPWLPFLDPSRVKPGPMDPLISQEGLAGCSRRELTIVLDRYLGGGITATPYFEDLVGIIILRARAAWRKARLFDGLCLLVGVGQSALLVLLLCR